jgi:hypothetical protein
MDLECTGLVSSVAWHWTLDFMSSNYFDWFDCSLSIDNGYWHGHPVFADCTWAPFFFLFRKLFANMEMRIVCRSLAFNTVAKWTCSCVAGIHAYFFPGKVILSNWEIALLLMLFMCRHGVLQLVAQFFKTNWANACLYPFSPRFMFPKISLRTASFRWSRRSLLHWRHSPKILF